MLQNLRKLDVHMKSLNIVCYQLLCTVRGVPPPLVFCVWLFEKSYAITDREDEPTQYNNHNFEHEFGWKEGNRNKWEKKKKKCVNCVMGTIE